MRDTPEGSGCAPGGNSRDPPASVGGGEGAVVQRESTQPGSVGPVHWDPAASRPAARDGAAAGSQPQTPPGLAGLVRASHSVPRAGGPASYGDRAMFATLEAPSRCWVGREGWRGHNCHTGPRPGVARERKATSTGLRDSRYAGQRGVWSPRRASLSIVL